MKYRVTQPFIAFGMTVDPGAVVELTEEQATALMDMDSVTPYETKVQPLPENKTKKKPSGSSRPARRVRKKTRRSSKPSAKK